MRLENAQPRTWLLATVAGWAALAWLLAVLGMGGRVDVLPLDASLLQPLPPTAATPAVRLKDTDQYSEIAKRPLFADDRRPHPFFLQGEGEEEQDNSFDYVLTSVLITPGFRMAIIQPADGSESVRVKVDEAPESHPSWRLSSLSKRSAVFAGPEGDRTLELRVFDGQGGIPPTTVSSGSGRTGRPTILIPDESGVLPLPPPPPPPSAKPATSPANASMPDQPPKSDESSEEANLPMTQQSQMEAIRQRIQERRAKLRAESSQQSPPEGR